MNLMKDNCHICGNSIINEPFVSLISGMRVHDNCLNCNICGVKLTKRCFELANVYLCDDDYARKKLRTCPHCKQLILTTDVVLYSLPNIPYHKDCFKCSVCNRILSSGDKYIAPLPKNGESTILCEQHMNGINTPNYMDISDPINYGSKVNYHGSISGSSSSYFKYFDISNTVNGDNTYLTSTSSYMADDDIENGLGVGGVIESDLDRSCDDMCSSEDRNVDIRRRTPRTTIKASQLDSLKSTFAMTTKPSRQIREQLAECTGLSMRVIQVWFQNRRSKERRCRDNTPKKTKFHNKLAKSDDTIKNNVSYDINNNSTYNKQSLTIDTGESSFQSAQSNNPCNPPPSRFPLINKIHRLDYSNSDWPNDYQIPPITLNNPIF